LTARKPYDRDAIAYPEFVRAPTFAITPHPDAPAFASLVGAETVLKQLVAELGSTHPQVGAAEVIDLFRQAGFVSLWFFLKFVAGAYNPYNGLNADLHLDMCNFRQSRWCMASGARAAVAVFRGSYKSTIMDHGAAAWELTRFADECFLFLNAKAERAHEWKWTVQRIFDSNPLFAALYPERVPRTDAKRWNDKEMVTPGRSRHWKEPSIQAAGIEGAKEGDHFTVIHWDDPIGLDSLDSMMASSTLMEAADKKFKTDSITLLRSKRKSRNLVFFTFYAPDDLYVRRIARNCKQVFGFKNDEIQVEPEGEWTLYYRSIVEGDRETCPEVLTKIDYERLLIDDQWTAIRHYKNSIKPIAGAGGIANARVKSCVVVKEEGRFWIKRKGDENFDEKGSRVALDGCTTVLQLDPAGTEGNITSQTSKSSLGLTAKDSDDNHYRIWERVGYFGDAQLYDYVFEAHQQFPGYIQRTIVETNAMQVVLVSALYREMEMRKTSFSLEGKPSKGDKKARVRHLLGPVLTRGKFYAAEGCARNLIEELSAFPGSDRLDVLDEQANAVGNLERPATATEIEELEHEDEWRRFGVEERGLVVADAFGY